MCAEEVWNSVEVYGPQADIDRFKALCIVPAPPEDCPESTHTIDFSRIIPPRTDPNNPGHPIYYAWDFPSNFSAEEHQERGTYEFAFDTSTDFPTPVFERLADIFPSLAFHCECIACFDEFMGFGWFNVPKGGEAFDFYDVPADYWDTGGPKREPMAELRHQACLAKVKSAARQASES